VFSAREQWWSHEAGCEYLAANPIDIPGLSGSIKGTRELGAHVNVNSTAFPRRKFYHIAAKDAADAKNKPNTSTDPFSKLPEELRLMIMDYLPSSDITNLRLSSRIFVEIPIFTFRRLILQDLPWFWEAKDLSLSKTNWYQLYMYSKFYWANFKGIQNRKRIWKHVEEIVRRIKPFMEESNEMQ